MTEHDRRGTPQESLHQRRLKKATPPARDRTQSPEATQLTPREQQVLNLSAQGTPEEDIGIRLSIFKERVQKISLRIRRKFGIHARRGENVGVPTVLEGLKRRLIEEGPVMQGIDPAKLDALDTNDTDDYTRARAILNELISNDGKESSNSQIATRLRLTPYQVEHFFKQEYLEPFLGTRNRVHTAAVWAIHQMRKQRQRER